MLLFPILFPGGRVSSQREWSADDYPTRRQLRTAASPAEADNSATDEETTGSHTTSTSTSADSDASYPSRRQLRAQQRAQAGTRTRRGTAAGKHPRRWLPRLAVLGALGALTTVVPLTGVALPSSSVDTVADAPLAESSALEVFSAGGTQISTEASAALAADPLASLRTMVSTSRSSPDRTT